MAIIGALIQLATLHYTNWSWLKPQELQMSIP